MPLSLLHFLDQLHDDRDRVRLVARFHGRDVFVAVLVDRDGLLHDQVASLLVLDHLAEALLREGIGIEDLVASAALGRQRDQQAGLAQCQDLADRVRSRAGNQNVCRRKQVLEVFLDVFELAVALDVLKRDVEMPLATQMHDLESPQEFRQFAAHRVVDGNGALAAAHDHENRLVRRKAADGKSLVAVTGEELTPDRRARQDCFVGGHHLERLREITADLGSRAEAQLIGKAGRHIGLVDHTGNVERSGRAHHRHTDKAALGKDDVRSVFLEKFASLSESVDHAEGIREVLEVKISPELTRRDPQVLEPI